MRKVFGYHIATLCEGKMTVGMPIEAFAPTPEPTPAVPPARLYAFSITRRGGSPRVFDYDNTSEGQVALANLIRDERVLKVVLGYPVEVEQASTVEMQLPAERLVHRVTNDDE